MCDSCSPQPPVFVAGPKVYLRPPEEADIPNLVRWVNDPDTRRLIAEVKPMSPSRARTYLERIEEDEKRVWFIIVKSEDNRAIGEAGLLRLFPAWRCADISIIIGEVDQRRKGYGTETAHLLLDYAFGELALHRVSVGVVDFNTGALEFWRRLGFRQEGVQRDGCYIGHQFHNFIMMSLLESEYLSGR